MVCCVQANINLAARLNPCSMPTQTAVTETLSGPAETFRQRPAPHTVDPGPAKDPLRSGTANGDEMEAVKFAARLLVPLNFYIKTSSCS